MTSPKPQQPPQTSPQVPRTANSTGNTLGEYFDADSLVPQQHQSPVLVQVYFYVLIQPHRCVISLSTIMVTLEFLNKQQHKWFVDELLIYLPRHSTWCRQVTRPLPLP